MSYNWQTVTTKSPTLDLAGIAPGLYEIEVVAINGLGVRSDVTSVQQYVSPQANVPLTISGASITPLDETTGLLTWDRTDDVNVTVGGQVIINHSPNLEASDWNYSTEIIPRVSGAQNTAVVPLLQGTYLLKYSSSTGVRSSAAAITTIKPPRPQRRLTVQDVQEDTAGFLGDLTGLNYDAGRGGLVLKYDFDSLALDGNFDGLAELDSLGGVKTSGSYAFDALIDLGAVYDLNLTRRLAVEPFNIITAMDENIAYIDTWGDFDGVDITDANAGLYVRTTESGTIPVLVDSNTAPIDEWPDFDYGSSWSAWRVCTNNLLRGRVFEFKVALTSAQINQNLVVTELGVTAELQQRVAHSTVLTSSSTTYTATFENAFYQAPAVNITPIDLNSGDYFTLASISASGFQLTFYDSGDNPVNRDFTYTAVGYGRRY
jgi:hypothetical protein